MTLGSTVAKLGLLTIAIAVADLVASPALGQSVAHATSINGNGWVALGVIAVAIGLIFMLIMGALSLEKRDASLGRRRKSDDGWFGIIPSGGGDDDDFHHHGGGHGGHGFH